MLPKVIIHNSISLDGSLTNFEPNMQLHYQIAGNYKPQIHLIGSKTAEAGLELYEAEIPPEEEKDYKKPPRDRSLPYWAILDTRGILKGQLHVCRRFEYCKDVIVLISEKTPREYVEFLKERNYDYIITGKEQADLKTAVELLATRYKAKKILTDTGRVLGNLLLEQGLVSEISLLVHPIIVGSKAYRIFDGLKKVLNLKLLKAETLNKGYVWLVYKVCN